MGRHPGTGMNGLSTKQERQAEQKSKQWRDRQVPTYRVPAEEAPAFCELLTTVQQKARAALQSGPLKPPIPFAYRVSRVGIEQRYRAGDQTLGAAGWKVGRKVKGDRAGVLGLARFGSGPFLGRGAILLVVVLQILGL